MLSLLLKALFNNSDSTTELPFDTEISLSMIESGSIFISLDQMAALIIKGSPDEIDALKNINRITFNFELIERPEFPSLGMHIEINTASNNSFNFDYFFNTESEGDSMLLKKLKDQNHFDIHFYTTEVLHSKKIELGTQDKLEFNSLIDKATS